MHNLPKWHWEDGRHFRHNRANIHSVADAFTKPSAWAGGAEATYRPLGANLWYLAGRAVWGNRIALERTGIDERTAEPSGGRIERDAAGRVSGLRFQGQSAPRVEPVSPDAVALAEYAGVYYSDEIGATYTVSVEEGRLVASHRRTGDVRLAPVARDEFAGDRWYFRGVEFVRDSRGHVSGLRVTGGRVKGLPFERVSGMK